MLAAKLYVSATDATGGFAGRGMVSLTKALETFDIFADDGAAGQAVFMVLSNHDGRIELRNGSGGFAGRVIARAARAAILGGLFPAREAVVWQVDGLDRAEAHGLITALYRLPASEFRAQVRREMAG